ncbi:WG repeat-containing protein [Pedobacter cryoconitis]|uniref:WG repeat protein n=1 Tax=Pedobacter cryoconitis TaxID=188932 RepID=A0A7X0J002_9SPHI|nr:WG repeat-containing protein [Pedobacter cryoconitis]MBB6498531.1 hypothetical protein [Pedobacter cryoconitis]
MNTVLPVNAEAQEYVQKLYPWLAKTGEFGYCDSIGNIVIKPRFEDARSFINGYAFVKEKDKYSVINQNGQAITEPKSYAAGLYSENFYSLYKKSGNYETAGIFSDGLFTLLITKKVSDDLLPFWKWERGPLFFFKYSESRTKWEIYSLPEKKRLFRQTVTSWETPVIYQKGSWDLYNNAFKFPFSVATMGRNLAIRDQLYQLDARNSILETSGKVTDIFKDTVVTVPKETIADKLPFKEGVPCKFSKDCYMAKDPSSGKYGVFDTKTGSWKVKPEYDGLKEEIAEHIIVYMQLSHLKGWPESLYGLLDVGHNKTLTPAKYNNIARDGRVNITEYVKHTDYLYNTKNTFYYINIYTGREYKE